jgi:hypothetical protein
VDRFSIVIEGAAVFMRMLGGEEDRSQGHPKFLFGSGTAKINKSNDFPGAEIAEPRLGLLRT